MGEALRIYSPLARLGRLQCETSRLFYNTQCITYRDAATRSGCPIVFANNISIGSEILGPGIVDAIAIGRDAVSTEDGGIAIGRSAESSRGSIVLNTDEGGLYSGDETGFFVSPVRTSTTLTSGNVFPLFHDGLTKEIVAVPYDNSIISVGDVKMSARSSDFNGWLLCDGRSLNATIYSRLFAVIGYTFGGGRAQPSICPTRSGVSWDPPLHPIFGVWP